MRTLIFVATWLGVMIVAYFVKVSALDHLRGDPQAVGDFVGVMMGAFVFIAFVLAKLASSAYGRRRGLSPRPHQPPPQPE